MAKDKNNRPAGTFGGGIYPARRQPCHNCRSKGTLSGKVVRRGEGFAGKIRKRRGFYVPENQLCMNGEAETVLFVRFFRTFRHPRAGDLYGQNGRGFGVFPVTKSISARAQVSVCFITLYFVIISDEPFWRLSVTYTLFVLLSLKR